jgi:hypothetical protein
MKKVTQKAVEHFLSNKPFKDSNTFVKVTATSVYLFLFDNCIAERNKHGLFVSNCGWFTNITKERLNALPGVSIHQKRFKWYLNGKEWNGELIKVQNN